LRNGSDERQLGREETITQAFEALVESIDKLLTFHAEEADLVAHLEKAKALAQHGLQLSRELPE